MKLQKLLKSLMTVSLLVGSVASADWQAPPGDDGFGPGRGHGPGRGPVDYCDTREGFNDPRCHRGRGPGRGDWGRGPGRGDWGRGPGRGPGHGGPGPGRPPYVPPQQPPIYNPPPPRQSESSIVFGAVSRRPGGEWLRVSLYNPVRIDYVQVQVLNAAVQLHDAAVVTRSGARYNLRELTRTGIIYSVKSSEYFGLNEQVVAIDIRAESMGGFADLRVNVLSDYPSPLQGSRF